MYPKENTRYVTLEYVVKAVLLTSFPYTINLKSY